MTVNGIPQQLTDQIRRFAYLRTGTVTLVDPFAVTVTVGQTSIRAAYARQSEPKVGDVVSILRQAASWMVIGTSSASGGNSVVNPSFELTSSIGFPTGWILYRQTGTMDVQAVRAPGLAVEGDNVLSVVGTGTVGSTCYVYSSPIKVLPSQQWELSVYADGYYPNGGTAATDISLRALWMANATDAYPTASDPETTVASITNIAETGTMQLMRGTITVPTASGTTAFMRVALRTVANPRQGVRYDFATARRVA